MNNSIRFFIALLIAFASTACSSTAADTTGTVPETDAAPQQADTANTDDTVRPDANVAETAVTDDAAQADANPDVGQDVAIADSPDASSTEDVMPDVPTDTVDADAATDSPTVDAEVELPLGQPIVELTTPTSLALAAGTHEVRYSVRSTGLPIAVKKTEIFFRERNADGATPWYTRWRLPLDGTRFLRDGVEVDPTTYHLVGWVFPMVAGTSSITVEWQTEEVVSMTGHNYQLITPVTGTFETGDSLEVILYSGNSTAPIERGRLTPNGSNFGLYHVPGPHVWIGTGRCVVDEIVWDGYVRPSSFVWSDMSGRGHTTSDCASAGSSDDWFTRAMTITGGTYTLTTR